MSLIEAVWQGRRKNIYKNAYVPRDLSQIPKSERTAKHTRRGSAGSTAAFTDQNPFRRRSDNLSTTNLGVKKAEDTHDHKRKVSTISQRSESILDNIESKAKDHGTGQDDDSPKKPVIKSAFHEIVYKFVESKFFSVFILVIILLNTIVLISTTWDIVNIRWSWYFDVLENIFLGIYLMEVVLKLYVWSLGYFKEGWNNLDFVIVIFSLVEFLLPFIVVQNIGWFGGTKIFRVLKIFKSVRAIRAFRVLRAIRLVGHIYL